MKSIFHSILECLERHENNKQERHNKLMEAIQALKTSVDAAFAGITADLNTFKASFVTITTGVQALVDAITAFQNSPGTLSAEDQAAVDAIQKSANDLKTATDAVVATIPVIPPPPTLPTTTFSGIVQPKP